MALRPKLNGIIKTPSAFQHNSMMLSHPVKKSIIQTILLLTVLLILDNLYIDVIFILIALKPYCSQKFPLQIIWDYYLTSQINMIFHMIWFCMEDTLYHRYYKSKREISKLSSQDMWQFWNSIKVLLWKHSITLRRNKKVFAIAFIVPLFIFLCWLDFKLGWFFEWSKSSPNPPSKDIGQVPRCTRSETGCRAIAYALLEKIGQND